MEELGYEQQKDENESKEQDEVTMPYGGYPVSSLSIQFSSYKIILKMPTYLALYCGYFKREY